MFMEVSAKVGINVKSLFKDLASSLPGIAEGAQQEKAATQDKGFTLGGSSGVAQQQ